MNSPIGMKIEIFFVGNDHLHQLTRLGISDLYIRLEKFTGGWAYARYNNFSVTDESDGYRMRVKVDLMKGTLARVFFLLLICLCLQCISI